MKLRAALLLAFACFALPALAQKSADTLRFGLGGALDVIDPYYTGDREVTMIVGEMVFDTLIYRDPATFEHKPLLATAWRWTAAAGRRGSAPPVRMPRVRSAWMQHTVATSEWLAGGPHAPHHSTT